MHQRDATVVYFVMGAFLLFLLGMGVGSILTKVKPAEEKSDVTTEQHKNGKLTSPLLSCEIAKNTGMKEFTLYKRNSKI